MRDADGLAGTYVDWQNKNVMEKPADQLLRWHFHQSVLANMRGTGEPVFAHDFAPGADERAEIAAGPKASERMEFELFCRLNCAGVCT